MSASPTPGLTTIASTDPNDSSTAAKIEPTIEGSGNEIEGSEEDDEYDDGEVPTEEGAISEPFDPAKIRIDTKPMTVDLLVKRMQADEIDLSPNFQRAAGLWTDTAKSRLIESLLIRIPIPAFYMDATNEDRWLVVDGLQRLTALKRFLVDVDDGSTKKALRLENLEYLKNLNEKQYSELPRIMQRRISEAEVVVYLIRPGTPPEVKFNVFKRINTGGMPLSPQEIRHALNQQGNAPALLERLASGAKFKQATAKKFDDGRMTDRECVLRFLAFVRIPPAALPSDKLYRDLDTFLNQQMESLNTDLRADPSLSTQYEDRLTRAMTAAHDILGKYAFRKVRNLPNRIKRRGPVQKALFEAWAVNLDALDDEQIETLKARKNAVLEGFIELLNQHDFDAAVTQATGDRRRIQHRFGCIRHLLKAQLSYQQELQFPPPTSPTTTQD
jgi:hypothetical protein